MATEPRSKCSAEFLKDPLAVLATPPLKRPNANRHPAFGKEIHDCLGAALGKLYDRNRTRARLVGPLPARPARLAAPLRGPARIVAIRPFFR